MILATFVHDRKVTLFGSIFVLRVEYEFLSACSFMVNFFRKHTGTLDCFAGVVGDSGPRHWKDTLVGPASLSLSYMLDRTVVSSRFF